MFVVPRRAMPNRVVTKNSPMEIVESVKFVNRFYPTNKVVKDGDWQIVKVASVENGDTFTVVGNMVAMTDEYDTIYKIGCTLKYNDKREEWQYVPYYSQEVYEFKTLEDQKTFLGSILSESQLNRLFETFENPIQMFEEERFDELLKVKGIGAKTLDKIKARYDSCKDKGKAYVELGKYGLSVAIIERLVKRYNSPDVAVSKVKENPYVLATEVKGIGFKKADEIALSVGMSKDSVERGMAFILHHFEEKANDGDSYMEYEELLKGIDEYLGVEYPDDSIDEAMRRLNETGKLWFKDCVDDDGYEYTLVANRKYYEIEKEIAYHIKRLMDAPTNIPLDRETAMEMIKNQQVKQGWNYTERQIEGIFACMENNVVVITGLGGTGKSSCVSGVLKCVEGDYSFCQTALSGRAAVNLADITGEEGLTIHSLLGYNPKTHNYAHNEENPLCTDMLILDEASMVDIELALHLLRAVPTGAKFVMLGDTNQLEAIGAGNLLMDLIDSEAVATIVFDKVHRQGAKSAIKTESKKIADGEQLVGKTWVGEQVLGELQDLKYIGFTHKYGSSDARPTIDLIVNEFKEMFKEAKEISDIAIVVPTRANGSGCYPINLRIQDIYLPKRSRGTFVELGTEKQPFNVYVGDKVINLKNNRTTYYYEKGTDEYGNEVENKITRPIYNGNVGEVVEIIDKSTIVVDFYNIGKVIVTDKQLDEIALGYAITVHKCLTGSTQVLTNKGMMSLKDLDMKTKDYDYVEIVDDSIKVYNGFEFEKPSHFYNAGINDTIKFKTVRGYEVESTLDHKFEVINSMGAVVVKEAKDITLEDFMIMREGANVYGKLGELPNEWFVLPPQNIRAKTYKLPHVMTERFARFLGFMIADGVVTSSGFSFGKQWKEVVEQFCEDVESLFGFECKDSIKHIPSTVNGGLGIWKIECNSKFLRDFLLNIEELKPNRKAIPNVIKQSSKECMVQFLRAIFEDGTVRLKNGKVDNIALQLKDESIIFDLQNILLNMGIKTSKKSRVVGGKYKHHILYIYGSDIKTFKENIGFISNFKDERIQKFYRVSKHMGDTTIIPHAHSLVKEALKFNIPQSLRNRINEANRKQRCTVELMKDVLKWSVEANEHIDALQQYTFLLEGFFMQQVDGVERGREQCYCITMPETHRFIQNGFYGLNCQGSTVPYVIGAIDYTHYSMLTRQLAYTLMSRAKTKMTFIFESNALHYAIYTNDVTHKRTFLYHILTGRLE